MLTLVFSMHALGAFPIACRRQWRTPNTQVRTMHVEHQMENMFPPKAEMHYWGHRGIGNVLPKIVKLPNIHQRLTREKMRMDNLSSRRSALANFERSALFRKSASSRREVIREVIREEALLRISKEALFFARALLLDERLFMHIFWRVRRWWIFGSLTFFGRTLPIPQWPQYCISAFGGGEHVLHLVLHVHCAHSGIRRAPLSSTSDWKSAKSVHTEH